MIDRRMPLAAGLVIATALWAGCGSKAIPTAAFEGTTITVAIPDGFDVGFGTKLASNPAGVMPTTGKVFPQFQAADIAKEDLQRGELVFRLQDTSSSGAIADVGLPVRWIGRAAPDPASYFGNAESRQVVALLDIPFGLVDDDPNDPLVLSSKNFEIMIERYRRDPTDMNTYVLVRQSYFPDDPNVPGPGTDWFGWGSDDVPSRTPPNQRIPIKIYDSELVDASESGTAGYTPLEGWGPYINGNGEAVRTTPFFSYNLPFYTPSPEVMLRWDIATSVDRPGRLGGHNRIPSSAHECPRRSRYQKQPG